MNRKFLGTLVCMLLIASVAVPVAANINESKNVYDKECGCCHGNSINLSVGICDNFTLPTEPTYPSTTLLNWINANYPNPGSRDCDETGEDKYWAHTFNLSGLCNKSCIIGATLSITIKNLDYYNNNDGLGIGCIDNNTDTWDIYGRLWDIYNIPLGEARTIVIDLTNYPSFFSDMVNHCYLDVVVQDDSAVDCAILTILCGQCIDPPANLKAWWPLDEGSTPGGLSADIIGDNHGTWVGSPVPLTGKVAGALNFPTDNDYVQVPDDPDLNFGFDDFTIDCWVYRTLPGDTEERTIISKRAGDLYEQLGYCLFLNANQKLSMILGTGLPPGGGYKRWDTTFTIPVNKWTFVAAVVDRTYDRLELYVNNMCTAWDIPNFNSTVTNNGSLLIGKDHFISTHAFRGAIDEVELFDRALYEGEIWQIFNAGCSGKCKPDLCCNGSCSWSNVTPGGTVTCSFTVSNCGGPGSELDWEITSSPGWGTWMFSPSSGQDLKPATSPQTISLTLTAPNVQNQNFSGKIKICNKHNPNDCCSISVSITTPKNKVINTMPLFLRFLQRHPYVFPILRQLLGL